MKKIIIAFLIAVQSITPKYDLVSSERAFKDAILKEPYALVCFAPSRLDSDNQDQDKDTVKQDFRTIKRNMQAAAKVEQYKDYLKDKVRFILVDIGRRRAEEVDDHYELTQIPTCLLFKHGKPVLDNNSYAQIVEPLSKYSMLSLLEKYFDQEFSELIKEKKEEEALERQERIARYNAYALSGYPYSNWGWGSWPYHGGYWGHRPYWGGYYRRGCW